MCGIAGILGLPEHLAVPAAGRMHNALSHRGPDAQGVEVIRPAGALPVVLAHRRLAILDLTDAGRQPMCDRPVSGSPANWIVFNGEVFNYERLHAPLAAAGWPCRTRSDTEVILHGYRAWGESCVDRFRGMFAWCLIDSGRGRAWFCRDRLGIKPLYLFRPAAGGLLFASELRALLAAGEELVPRVICDSALESFLAQGAVIGEQSIVRGVVMLAPGESVVTDLAGTPVSSKRYWQMPGIPSERDVPDRAASVRALGTTLREAVALRLISDRPLGLFLSAGIDSTSLATLATEVASSRITSLSIGFDQPEWNEAPEAARIAAELGTEHRELQLTGESLLADLPLALQAMDQPTVDGFNTYFVSRAAREAGLTVALSGLGGDELFGGYASFRDVPRAVRWQHRIRRIPGAGFLMRAFSAANRRSGVKAAQVARRPVGLLPMYLLRRELFLEPSRRQLHGLPPGVDAMSGIPDEVMAELARFDSTAGGTSVAANPVSRLELSCYMRHMLLRDADAFSMASALELRVPLLDHVLVEQVAELPGLWKQPDPRPKPLLIDAVGARFPGWVTHGRKRGFTFPWGGWLRGAMRTRVEDSMRNRSCWDALGVDASAVERMWRQFLAGNRRVLPLQILGLVVLEDFTRRHKLRRAASSARETGRAA